MPAPKTFEALSAAIAAHHSGLSRRLQQLARFAPVHPNDMALETISVIARRADVQPSSLIRFAQTFGYAGFSEMQRVFQARLVARSPSYAQRIAALKRGDGQGAGSSKAVLHAFAAASIAALEHLSDEIPAGRLDRAVSLLARARQIYVVGQRRSFPIAAYLTYAIGQLGRPTRLLDGVGGMLDEQARPMARGDALITVSFKDYAAEVVDLVARAAGLRIPIVAITDGPLSPLASHARIAFGVHDAEVQSFRALTASMCLAQALAVGLGLSLARRRT